VSTRKKLEKVDRATERLTGKPKVHTGSTVMSRPVTMISIPMREIHGLDVLALGLKTVFFESEGGEVGAYSGAGVGSTWVQFKFKERDFAVHVGELLLACLKGRIPAKDYEDVRQAVEAMGGGSMCSASGG